MTARPGLSLMVALSLAILAGTAFSAPPQTAAEARAMAESWPVIVPANAEFLELGNLPPASLRVPSVINVEVDIMKTAGHTHGLQPNEIAMIVGMFACEGITINIEISDTIPETAVIDMSSQFATEGANGFKTIKDAWVDHAPGSGWHYCIMAHEYDLGGGPTSSSGFGEIVGDDFIVTLGDWQGQIGRPFDRAGTFVHELGHNLGLRHAGSQNEGSLTQYKPNYASVMTYRCQVNGVRKMNRCSGLVNACYTAPFRDLDYSHGLLPVLDESALIEPAGVGLGSVDWDCDLVIDALPVAHDLGSTDWCFATGPLNFSLDYDDWSNLVDVSYLAPVEALANRPTTSCMDLDELNQVVQQGTDGSPSNTCDYSSPVIQVEPCVYPEDDADSDGLLASCDNCPALANPLQEDADLDGKGDLCDNCPSLSNANQADGDNDGAGNVCDNCPVTPNAAQANFDGDAFGDVCDNCPNVSMVNNVALLTGDVNNNGNHASDDVIILVNYTFKGGASPIPVAAVGDVNCSGTVTSGDIIDLVNYVFKSGHAPCNVCALH